MEICSFKNGHLKIALHRLECVLLWKMGPGGLREAGGRRDQYCSFRKVSITTWNLVSKTLLAYLYDQRVWWVSFWDAFDTG